MRPFPPSRTFFWALGMVKGREGNGRKGGREGRKEGRKGRKGREGKGREGKGREGFHSSTKESFHPFPMLLSLHLVQSNKPGTNAHFVSSNGVGTIVPMLMCVFNSFPLQKMGGPLYFTEKRLKTFQRQSINPTISISSGLKTTPFNGRESWRPWER